MGRRPLFFGAKVSCNIFIFIQTNSITAAKLRKCIKSVRTDQSVSYIWANLGIFQPVPPVSFTWMDILQYLSTKPQPVSVHWMGIPLNISTLPLVSFNWVYIPGYLSTRPLPVSFNGRRQVPTYLFIYLLPNKTQDHQPTWEIQEPEETHPNLSGPSEEVDGYKRPLLVPRLQFLEEVKQRREVHSGSLLHGRCKTVDFFFLKHNVKLASQVLFAAK